MLVAGLGIPGNFVPGYISQDISCLDVLILTYGRV
jgi:hypothetical protein